MTLKEKINADYKEAFKAKEEKKVSVLRMLNAAIKNKEVEKRVKLAKEIADDAELEKQSQLNDEEVLTVIGSQASRRKDSIAQYEEGGRPELATQEKEELAILAVYLPAEMSEDEIRKNVQEAIKESGASGVADLGKVMKVLMPRVKGKADGNLVNQIVKAELSK